MVSLFPEDTWKNRPNGLRADLVQMLADLKPGFLRFPGGCIVEGRRPGDCATSGRRPSATSERTAHLINRWNDEFKHRPAPDYFQSFGLGFFEYFQLCEDIGAEPLPILNCGMACQFNSGELVPLDAARPVHPGRARSDRVRQRPGDSTWGGQRAEMGHPRPFGLKLLGVGNEQWGPQYFERYERFARGAQGEVPGDPAGRQRRARSPAGTNFEFLWAQAARS